MPKRLIIQPHVSLDELERRYRRATHAGEHSHFQIIWLLAQGKPSEEVAEVTGYCLDSIRKLARRYNEGGPGALADRRHEAKGAPPLLSPAQQDELRLALSKPAPDGGLWTSPKVAAWMAERTGKAVHFQRGWEYLRRLGYSPQRPRPRHAKADPQVQEAFKKKSFLNR